MTKLLKYFSCHTVLFITTLLLFSNYVYSKETLSEKNSRLEKSNGYIGINVNFDTQRSDADRYVGPGITYQYYATNDLLISSSLGFMSSVENSNDQYISRDRVDSNLLLANVAIKQLFGNKEGPYIGFGIGYSELKQKVYQDRTQVYSSKSRMAPVFFTTGWLININNRISIELGLNIDSAELGFSDPIIDSTYSDKNNKINNPALEAELRNEYNSGVNYTNFFLTGTFNTDMF